MINDGNFDVVIIGGSYAGLSAAMALGRALRSVLIIDNGNPCNRQTPHSHNFLTNDGRTPAEISALAKLQVKQYDTINFITGTATVVRPVDAGFEINIASGEVISAKKLIIATGLSDQFPAIPGFSECWGISVIHCPFCHGYEVRNKPTGILGNGDAGFDFLQLIRNWTSEVTLFTNGPSILSPEQATELYLRGIEVNEKIIEQIEHRHGLIRQLAFTDGPVSSLDVLYAPRPFKQHSTIPESLGCAFTSEGYIRVDPLQETSIKGVYAVGDATNKIRTVANAVASGTTAGMTLSKQLIFELNDVG